MKDHFSQKLSFPILYPHAAFLITLFNIHISFWRREQWKMYDVIRRHLQTWKPLMLYMSIHVAWGFANLMIMTGNNFFPARSFRPDKFPENISSNLWFLLNALHLTILPATLWCEGKKWGKKKSSGIIHSRRRGEVWNQWFVGNEGGRGRGRRKGGGVDCLNIQKMHWLWTFPGGRQL